MVGTSVKGTSHRRAGLPCQDSFAYHHSEGVLIAAVADGAGSAAMSEAGSELATESSVLVAVESLEAHRHEGAPIHDTCLARIARVAFAAALSRIVQEAVTEKRDVREYATTLIVAIHVDKRLVVGQVGDGAVVYSNEKGGYTTAIAPARGEYANQTTFLTSPGALKDLEVETKRLESETLCIAMFTDGLQNLVLDSATKSPHAPFFDPVFSWMGDQTDIRCGEAHLSEFLSSPKVTGRADDDLTLLLAMLGE